MAVYTSQFSVLFQDPFWIGIYERNYNGRYQVAKITFGAEPKDYEVFHFLLMHWKDLDFGSPVKLSANTEKQINPKRMQRLIRKQMEKPGIGTKAQQALKAEQEKKKLKRKIQSRDERVAEKQRQFELKQVKRKEKHRGH